MKSRLNQAKDKNGDIMEAGRETASNFQIISRKFFVGCTMETDTTEFMLASPSKRIISKTLRGNL
jgi:hypothetical protein